MTNIPREQIQSLPDRTVQLESTRYHIHGLVHGTPWVRINPLFKQEINRRLQGLTVLCEDGFISWIPSAVSMNETEYFNFNKRAFLTLMRFFGTLLYSHIFSKNKKPEPEIISEVREMTSIYDLIEIREKLFRQYLPEPDGMNSFLRKSGCGSLDSPKGDIPLRVKRYLYEAKTAIDYAKRNCLEDLHIAVGCAHELPLEYLLQNPKLLGNYLI